MKQEKKTWQDYLDSALSVLLIIAVIMTFFQIRNLETIKKAEMDLRMIGCEVPIGMRSEILNGNMTVLREFIENERRGCTDCQARWINYEEVNATWE